jgi:hypothetical protein
VSEKRYIYAIGSESRTNAPMLVRAAVINAGPKIVSTNQTSLVFGCRSRHPSRFVHWTPEAAWDAFVANQHQKIESAKQQIERSERLIEQAITKRLVDAVDDVRGW